MSVYENPDSYIDLEYLTWVVYSVFIDAQLMIPPSTLLWLVTSMDRLLVRPPSLSRVSPSIRLSCI